jgi:hypothetical protein
VNGSELVSEVTSAPNACIDSIVVFIGRALAPASPSKLTCPSTSIDSGGTNRMTVPARPQSILAGPNSSPGVTSKSEPCHENLVPSALRDAIMSSVSRDTKGEISSVGSSANAESTSSRFVSDLLPGSKTLALTLEDSGAGQAGNSFITPKIQGMGVIGLPGRL